MAKPIRYQCRPVVAEEEEARVAAEETVEERAARAAEPCTLNH